MIKPTFTDFVIAFCQACKITHGELISERRDARTVRIRQALWAELRANGYSYNLIAKRTRRDHTTILSGVRRYAASVHSREFRDAVDRAKALVPEIAAQRASGVRIDLLATRQHEAVENPPARKPELSTPVPIKMELRYEQSVRAECFEASQKLAAALKSEVGAA